MKALIKLNQKENIYFKPTDFSNKILETINHSLVKESAEEMQQTHSIKPLFLIWESFTAYQSLDDEVFVEDFTKEVLVVSYNVMGSTHESKINRHNFNLKNNLERIENITKSFHRKKIKTNFEINNKTPLDEKMPTVELDDIAERFYFIERIKRHIELADNCTQLHSVPELNLMHEFWTEIQQYKDLTSESIVKNCTLLLVYLYHEINNLMKKTDSTIIQNIKNYEQLAHVETETLLDLLDDLFPAIQDFVHKINNSGSWLQSFASLWKRKYHQKKLQS